MGVLWPLPTQLTMSPYPVSALAALMLFAMAPVSAAPQRVVSFNLCTDQLVVALADPEQIAGLSPYAIDPDLSVVAEQAKRFRHLDWQAEATLPLDPDLVLTGAWDRSVTRRMLTRLGIRVVERDLIGDLAGARREITEVAALLGHPQRGRDLIATLDAAEARLAARAKGNDTTALVVERSGYAAGRGSFVASLLATAGLQPPAGAPGAAGGFIPLERLLMLAPDVIVLKQTLAEPSDQGALYLTHPALRGLYPPERTLILPTRFTLCGGPAAIAALDYLTEAIGKIAIRH